MAPVSCLFRFYGSSFIVRPSGTEPKIKVYLMVHDADKAKCDEKIERFAAYAESLKELK